MTQRDHPRGALVVLHGHAGSASTAGDLARAIDPSGRWHHVLPEGPWLVDVESRSWFESPIDHASAGRIVSTLITGLIEDGGFDPREIVVVGWSQGGAAALAALAVPGGPSVGSLILCSSFLAEGSIDYDFGALAGAPVLIQHGRVDEVVPAFFADDLVASLRAAGVEVTDERYDIGHERSGEADAAVSCWLDRAQDQIARDEITRDEIAG